jgi:hypothetical protein
VREATTAAKNARSPIGQLGTDSDGTLPTEFVKNDADFDAQRSGIVNCYFKEVRTSTAASQF